jgi:hypothetical protein
VPRESAAPTAASASIVVALIQQASALISAEKEAAGVAAAVTRSRVPTWCDGLLLTSVPSTDARRHRVAIHGPEINHSRVHVTLEVCPTAPLESPCA